MLGEEEISRLESGFRKEEGLGFKVQVEGEDGCEPWRRGVREIERLLRPVEEENVPRAISSHRMCTEHHYRQHPHDSRCSRTPRSRSAPSCRSSALPILLPIPRGREPFSVSSPWVPYRLHPVVGMLPAFRPTQTPLDPASACLAPPPVCPAQSLQLLVASPNAQSGSSAATVSAAPSQPPASPPCPSGPSLKPLTP